MSTITKLDTSLPARQLSPRNDADLRDGDSAHGNIYEPAADERALDSDADIEDTTQVEEVSEALPLNDPAEAGVVGLSAASELPFAGYDRLTIPEVMEQVSGLSANELEGMIQFERTHRNRKTLLAKLRRLADRD